MVSQRRYRLKRHYKFEQNDHKYIADLETGDIVEVNAEEAKKAAAAARETALIVCGVAAIEPSPAGELACSLYLIRAGAKATYATLVCLTAKSICSRVA